MITADYIPGVTRPSWMTDSEITRELRSGGITRERRAQLLDHVAWLREYRRKPADQVPEISTYTDTGLKTGPPGHCRMPDCGHPETSAAPHIGLRSTQRRENGSARRNSGVWRPGQFPPPGTRRPPGHARPHLHPLTARAPGGRRTKSRTTGRQGIECRANGARRDFAPGLAVVPDETKPGTANRNHRRISTP